MKFQPDMNYLVESFRRIVETPSPVGFYSLLNPVLEKEAAQFGYEVTYDRRGTPYIIWMARTTASPFWLAPIPTPWASSSAASTPTA